MSRFVLQIKTNDIIPIIYFLDWRCIFSFHRFWFRGLIRFIYLDYIKQSCLKQYDYECIQKVRFRGKSKFKTLENQSAAECLENWNCCQLFLFDQSLSLNCGIFFCSHILTNGTWSWTMQFSLLLISKYHTDSNSWLEYSSCCWIRSSLTISSCRVSPPKMCVKIKLKQKHSNSKQKKRGKERKKKWKEKKEEEEERRKKKSIERTGIEVAKFLAVLICQVRTEHRLVGL